MEKFKAQIDTDYLYKIYYPNRYKNLLKKMTKAVKKFKEKKSFDAIAFTGTSGASIAYPLSLRLNIPLICIRKNDGNHWRFPVEGCINAKKYIIIDDFIGSGATVSNIISSITKRMPKAKPIGIFLYTSFPQINKWKKIPVMYPDSYKEKK